MRIVLAAALAGCLVAPAQAQTTEELQAELEAQKQINEIQRQRIESLERQLSGQQIQSPARSGVSPDIAEPDPDQERALERTLQRRGASVLPAGLVEVTPSISWAHSGRDVLATTDNLFAAGIETRIGLSSGWMIGASLPVIYRDIDGLGSNAGISDLSIAAWKALLAEGRSQPSVVASLRYSAPTGEDFGADNVPLGSGFHRVSGRITAVKSFDPIALYGDLSYTEHVSEAIAGRDVERSGIFGVGAGASLAVTPEISTSIGFDFSFEEAPHIDGAVFGGNRTVGTVELGLGILFNRTMFLNLVGAIGVTDDSPDITIGAALPIRF